MPNDPLRDRFILSKGHAAAALYAEAQGFDRVIHIESDAYVISAQARAFLTEFKDGWASFWSPLYSIPESAIQVVAGEGLRALAELFLKDFLAFG